MGKELSREEILNNVHWQLVVETGISSIHTKTFPEAYKQQALKAMQEYADQQSKKEAIDFLDSIRDYEAENGKRICFDERTSDELYQLYCSDKLKSIV